MTYEIHESLIEKLETKLAVIRRKCAKYGVEFKYEQVGEVFREEKNPNNPEEKVLLRYIKVDVEGKAQINNWEFVASVEKTENGNLIKGTGAIKVPVKYHHTVPFCEHCNTNRYRKYTYIVHNVENNEFKMVGKQCLCDYTHGMDSEFVALMFSWKDIFEEAEQTPVGAYFGYAPKYLDAQELLQYSAEATRLFGYATGEQKYRVLDYKAVDDGEYWHFGMGRESAKDFFKVETRMRNAGFNKDSAEAIELVEKAKAWIAEQHEESNYIANLKIVCGLEKVKYGQIGILVSLIQAYNKAMGKAEEQKKVEEQKKLSQHIGNVGDKITVEVESFKTLASFDTDFGNCFIYKFTTKDGNTVIWKTSKWFNDETEKIEKLAGTIKEHSEFRGEKQTVLTRCKVQ